MKSAVCRLVRVLCSSGYGVSTSSSAPTTNSSASRTSWLKTTRPGVVMRRTPSGSEGRISMMSWIAMARCSSAVMTLSASRKARGGVSFRTSNGLVDQSVPSDFASWPFGSSHLRLSGFHSSVSSRSKPSPSSPFLRRSRTGPCVR